MYAELNQMRNDKLNRGGCVLVTWDVGNSSQVLHSQKLKITYPGLYLLEYIMAVSNHLSPKVHFSPRNVQDGLRPKEIKHCEVLSRDPTLLSFLFSQDEKRTNQILFSEQG